MTGGRITEGLNPAIPAAPVPIGLLALAGFACGSGMRLLDPLLPQVAESLGVSVAGASAVIAGFMLPYGLGQVVLGPLGDRLGKLRVACVAVIFYGIAVLACSTAPGLVTLVLMRAASGLFAGAVIPLLIAYLGDTVPYDERQATIGQFLTGMVMAQMLAGPVSGVIGEYGGWRASFVVLGILAILIGTALAVRLGATLWRAAKVPGARVPGLTAYLALLSRPAGRWLLISAFFDGLCLFGGAFPYVGAFVIQAFGLTASTAGLAAGLLGLALAPDWEVAAAVQVFLGLMFYMFHGVLQARATEVLPEARGTAVSAFALSLFLGQTVGSLAFGALLALTGYRGGFAAAGAGVLILAVCCRMGLTDQPRPDPS